MGRQIGHHHHAKIKESDNLPYRDWLGQTEGGTGELAIGLMMTFCLPVISSHNPRHLQEPVVGDQLSLKRDFSLPHLPVPCQGLLQLCGWRAPIRSFRLSGQTSP